MTCPPCTKNCNQGRQCDADRRDAPLEMLAYLLLSAAVVVGLVVWALLA